MPLPNLADDDPSDLAALVREAIEAEPYRGGPRIKRFPIARQAGAGNRAQLDTVPAAAAERYAEPAVSEAAGAVGGGTHKRRAGSRSRSRSNIRDWRRAQRYNNLRGARIHPIAELVKAVGQREQPPLAFRETRLERERPQHRGLVPVFARSGNLKAVFHPGARLRLLKSSERGDLDHRTQRYGEH